MSQQDLWHAHLSSASMPVRQHYPNMGADDSSTIVNPFHERSSQWISPYGFSPETAIPPPPPGIDAPCASQSKRNRGYRIALTVLVVLVVVLGSLEVMQVTTRTPLTRYSSETTGSNQAVASSAQRTRARQHASPTRTVTPGTIKENATLTCGTCNHPVLTTLTSITIDTTDRRLIMTVTLQNLSGAQQIDYFAEFNLQDPIGNTYEGTGELNADFFLGVGQSAFRSEIFSFLPRPGVSYTLIAHLGIAGITYDPLQLTF
jgi:hypothetical protein